jgi:multiple sugar transport system ATP-binding protein
MATVSFKGATRIYPGSAIPAVERLDIQDGEFMVLVGPSGSGKSTALRMLAGLEEVNEGSICIGDRPAVLGHPALLYPTAAAVDLNVQVNRQRGDTRHEL